MLGKVFSELDISVKYIILQFSSLIAIVFYFYALVCFTFMHWFHGK